jgi:hypothetical protein
MPTPVLALTDAASPSRPMIVLDLLPNHPLRSADGRSILLSTGMISRSWSIAR